MKDGTPTFATSKHLVFCLFQEFIFLFLSFLDIVVNLYLP